ncbi:MAG TPA: transporter substrate-binding domain-containing protein [Thermotogota bacterium]|nr:transporter substrate-binding domain-containing protein [Thermotogota bacterium]HPM20893.1 transporter substrate-binding domain-containing protein [Thermotogota bacterium]
MLQKYHRTYRQNRRYRVWFVVFLALLTSSIILSADSSRVALSDEETAWLRENPEKLVLYFNIEFPPIEYQSESGDFTGMGADVLSEIEKRLQISFTKVPSNDWNDHLNALRTGRCAVAPTIVDTVERQEYIYFTDPYAVVPVVIITSKNTPGIVAFKDLAGKKVSVVSGYATEKYLQDESLLYGIEIVTVENVQKGLESVSFEETDAFVENLAVASYTIGRLGISNLRVAGETNYRFAWSIGISKEYPLLYSAVQKALRSIPKNELDDIRNRWIVLSQNGRVDPMLRMFVGFSLGSLVILAISLSILSFLLKRRLNQKVADLRKSEEKYRQTAENSPAVVYQLRVDASGHASFPYINESILNVAEVTAEAVMNDANVLLDMIHPDDKNIYEQKSKESATTLQPFNFIFRAAESEKPMWMEAHATPSRMPDGSIVWDGFFLDITERKIAEERLQESNERLKTVMDSIDSCVYIADMDTYELLFINEHILRSWGEQGRGRICWQSIQKGMDGPCPFCTNHLLVDENGKPTGIYQWEFQNTLSGRWYDCRDRAIQWTDGRIVRMEIATDITKRKLAEEALRESENKFSALFSAMNEMVALHELVLDAQGNPVDYRVLDCNEAYTKITGIEKKMVIGKLASEIFQTDSPPYLEEYSEVALTGKPLHFESFYAPFNKYFSLSIVSTEKNKFATITADISDSRRAEKVIEEKNKELEQIIYVASHDLRSPLVNVDGYSRELEYALDDFKRLLRTGESGSNALETVVRSALPDLEEALQHIRTSALQMDSLLKGLLRLSRSGRAALTFVPLEMNLIVKNVLSSMDYQITASEAHIEVEPLPGCVGDEVQITQVITNLLGNAIKYLDPERPGKIRVSGTVDRRNSIYCIEDNGVGIAPEHQEKIFQLFHRLNPAKTEGEGLGLTIVRQIINRHDGKIWVESESGKGSKFFFSIPTKKQQAFQNGNPPPNTHA